MVVSFPRSSFQLSHRKADPPPSSRFRALRGITAEMGNSPAAETSTRSPSSATGGEEPNKSFFKAENPFKLRNELPVNVKKFGYKTDIASEYEIGDQIGAGAFAMVRIATKKSTGEKFAVKSMFKKMRGSHLDPLFVSRVQHEVDILKHLGNSLSVAYLYDVYEDEKCVDLVMELCEGGQLWKRIRQGHYSESTVARIMQEVLRAIAQCHAAGVVVRDVKPENFLLLRSDPEDFTLKMIDFGIAQYCGPQDRLQDRAGTPVYVAPEILKQNYGQKADIWSAGIVAYMLLCGRLPFSGEDDDLAVDAPRLYETSTRFESKELWRMILYNPLDFQRAPWATGQISDTARDFVITLLDRDDSSRPTAEAALDHPWLRGVGDTADLGPRPPSPEAAPLAASLVQRIQRFGTYGRLKQVGLRAVASLLVGGSQDLQAVSEMFRAADRDGDGRLSYAEFAAVVWDSFDLSEAEVQQLLLMMDTDHEGQITYDEWVAALIDWQQVTESSEWEAWTHKAFDRFDSAHAGALSREDLGALLRDLNGAIMPDDVDAALREADLDRDEKIDFEDFERLLRVGLTRLDLFPSRCKSVRCPVDLDKGRMQAMKECAADN